ncbi:MAG: hypothetical protein HOO96_38520 [Polyangiaceae bacterium]|nr:hypothetical protein [Polyangiaceae bacterium]
MIAAEPSPFVWVPEYGLVAIAGGFVVATALFSLFARYRFRSLYDREQRADPKVSPRQVFAAQILYNRSRIAVSVMILVAFVVGLGVVFVVGNAARAPAPYRNTDME